MVFCSLTLICGLNNRAATTATEELLAANNSVAWSVDVGLLTLTICDNRSYWWRGR